MNKEKWMIGLAAGAGLAAVAYTLLSKNIPGGARAVQPFDINRYLGKWYEVARLPIRIEKNINQLTEEYTRNQQGGITVVTRGYHTQNKEWKEITGKMKLAGDKNTGMLKVSYFGPFYLAYNVLDLDPDYQYALVSGSSLDYLWLLSRQTTMPDHIKSQFLNTANKIGFDIGKLE